MEGKFINNKYVTHTQLYAGTDVFTQPVKTGKNNTESLCHSRSYNIIKICKGIFCIFLKKL